MKTLRLILGDHLSRSIGTLQDIDKKNDGVLMVEVQDETTYVKHHKQKLVFVLSAMRHFAGALEKEGLNVDYVRLDDKKNTGSLTGELKRAIGRHKPDRVIVTEPGEWRVWQMMEQWSRDLEIPVEILEDNRFLCSESEFQEWARGRKTLRMEHFYRHMRRKTGWLMDGDQPEGSQWNYDAENRETLPEDLNIPNRKRFEPDKITQDVIQLVQTNFSDHFGEVDSLGWAVTREDAFKAMKDFMKKYLPNFGNYQDAMKAGEDFLFHSVLSPYLNIGLLEPREVCEATLRAYEKNKAPINAVEGFIRQIVGWREYIRGIYWMRMPDYAQSNFFDATRPLPDCYWTGNTDMNCLKECIEATRRNAYAHHIQRLMVTGNFALLAGIHPAEVEEWYLLVYADAYEWVELPNTHGMSLFADGGLLASKPYAASGSYINRMSDYCKECSYSPTKKLGQGACPFNYLYWYFLMENKEKLESNPRMAMIYKTLEKMDKERKKQIEKESEDFLRQL